MSEQTAEQAPEQEASPTPLGIQVTGGNPTDEELGAALTVLAAVMAPAPGASRKEDQPRAGGWGSYTRMMRRRHVHGRDAWRFSGIPGAM